MMNFKNAMTVVAAAVILAPSALNAQVRMTVPPQSEAIAIQGATIHTVTNGVIENGTIIFNDGLITAIGVVGCLLATLLILLPILLLVHPEPKEAGLS